MNTRGGERKDQTVNDGYKLVAGPLTILLTAVVFLFFYLRNRKKGWTAIYYTVAVFALWSVYTVMVHTILPLPLDWDAMRAMRDLQAYQPIQWNPIASIQEGIQMKGMGSYLSDISWILRSGAVLGIVLPIVFPKAKRLWIQILTALGIGGFLFLYPVAFRAATGITSTADLSYSLWYWLAYAVGMGVYQLILRVYPEFLGYMKPKS